jgi:hypothetical protein
MWARSAGEQTPDHLLRHDQHQERKTAVSMPGSHG